MQDTSVTEAGALREEQLRASEQLANHSQAMRVVTDFDSAAGLEGGDGQPVLSRGRHRGIL